MISRRVTALALALAFMVPASPSFAQMPAADGGTLGFYRYPALHGDVLVFAAEGDLWRVPVAGGVAHRLTTHPAEETDPVISPDGATLAFTARYEGPAELYTMPLAGGLPVRHTYEGESSTAETWTPDGRVVYSTSHYATLPQNQLVAVDPRTHARERIPLYTATEGAYDDGGRTLYFVRPAFHNNVTKRYTGGTARDVWKFEAGADEAVELTGDYDGESHSPMYWRGRVYFVSDRDGTMNVWSMGPDGGDVRQHTRHSGWDVKNPALEGGRIVYQLGADLWLYDVDGDRTAMVPITLASDFDQLREKWVDDPMEYVTSAHLHPEGESVVLTSRGRVFVAPVAPGRLVRASVKEGVRYRDVRFLPGGEELVGLSDESGEFEWVTLPATGVGDERTLTSGGAILRFSGVPSPDGAWLAYDDNNADLWILNLDTGEQVRVSQDREGTGSVSWSPDSQWLAYEKTALNTFVQIKLFRPEDGARADVTSDRVNSFDPSWAPGGDFLYFLSDRNLRSLVSSPWGTRQPEPFFDRSNEIYEVALRTGLRSPFMPDDELYAEEEGPAGQEAEGADDAAPVDVELDGLAERVRRVPVRSGNFQGLAVNGRALFFMDRDAGVGAGAGPGGGGRLTAVAVGADTDAELTVVAEGVSGFEMSGDGDKLMVRQGSNISVIDARPTRAGNLADSRVDLSGWAFSMDVREDWRQLYVDAWRMERDYFYDPGMHGVDWEGVRDKYMALVDRVTTRDELSDVIGRVVGELSALHTAVRGGDLRSGEDNVRVATLGARLGRSPEEGGYVIERIYRSDPDYPAEMSPLADPYLGVAEGDVIERVNGRDALSAPYIGALLRNQNRPVRLRVRSAASGESRDVMVTPTLSESSLRYSDWEYTRRLDVEEKGGGQIGYLHLRAMGGANITEFYRNFYPVFNRQGLIIDVRRNNGGNIDSILLEKLLRKAWMYWQERVGQPTWNMQYAFRGHMVVLVDQNTASDGEAFAEGFRRLGLGPVIGMRTWGGEIWLGSSNRLTDGGLARAPSMGVYGEDRDWLIEQVGVIPDIVVDNLPHATFLGADRQLDAAIDYLLNKIATEPVPVPEPPPYPNLRFEYRGGADATGRGGQGQRR